MKVPDPASIAEEIERTIDHLRAERGVEAAGEAQHLLQLAMSFYGAGLTRMLEIVRGDRVARPALLEQFASDPLVASVLALHDLDPGSADNGLLQISRASDFEGRHQQTSKEERCDLCAVPIADEHAHLVDIEARRLLCACVMCTGVGGRYRLLPTRYVHEPAMTLSAAEWEPLGIPVGLVFFVINSRLGRTVASYPGPAGATESLLPLETWPALADRHSWLQHLEPDVEALLVRRVGDTYRCHIVPVDACYELVGRIRKAWSGFAGGALVESEIDQFFAGIGEKAQSHRGVPA